MAETSASHAEQAVREYYEKNTQRFLDYGQGGGQGAIHRAVWGPGITTRAAAFNYVNDLIGRQLDAALPAQNNDVNGPRVVDLGCGVGASLAYLAAHRAIDGLGITLSGVQVQIAQRRFASDPGAGRLRCLEGSFTDVPAAEASMDFAFSIEAFAHAPEPALFMAEAARLVRPGGLLVLCDDFLSEAVQRGEFARSARHQRWLREFRAGWRVSSVFGVSQVAELADQFDLVQDTDLTPYLELGRPRDALIRWLVGFGRYLPLRSPWWGNLLGGNALQRCLRHGVVEYRFVVFRRKRERGG
jgi:SAM-dependent methyltransferase